MLSPAARRESAGLRPCAPASQRIGRAAVAALYDELALAPKPGLVSFVDSGSHTDMDARTFMRSLFALRHYFRCVAMLGAMNAPFADLEALGLDAEANMLAATDGVNTHRGAIFTLGLLCAAAGWWGTRVSAEALRFALQAIWGPALGARRAQGSTSNGRIAAANHGSRGVRDEAALGFPTLFEHALPTLKRARRVGLTDREARLETLFQLIAVLDDTNLVHRGGPAGLRFAQGQARAFLAAGGAARPDAWDHAQAIHRAFVSRRLSPGGAADLLAAAGLVERLCIAEP